MSRDKITATFQEQLKITIRDRLIFGNSFALFLSIDIWNTVRNKQTFNETTYSNRKRPIGAILKKLPLWSIQSGQEI